MTPPSTQYSTVITAAADTRDLFELSGFGGPRNLVTVDGVPIGVRAVSSCTQQFEQSVFVLLRSEDESYGTAKVVGSWVPDLSYYRVGIPTRGALVSALLGLGLIDISLPLIVAAGDAEYGFGVPEQVEQWVSNGVAAATAVFQSSNPRWSYVRRDANGRVLEVAEKKVISGSATTGLFFFETAQLFLESATWCLKNNVQREGKFYVSAAMNFLIQSGRRVEAREIRTDEYRKWANPADLVAGGRVE